MGRMRLHLAAGVVAGATAIAGLSSAHAQIPAPPIPADPTDNPPPVFGGPVAAAPVASPDPPRHPFMAPNGRSNLHEDAYQTDVDQGPAPLGPDLEPDSAFMEGVCASVTFDSRDRLVTICVGVEGPKLVMLDPASLDVLAVHPLPPRQPGAASIFNDFAGGGYFYLDNEDRAVIPTTNRQIWIVATRAEPGFELERVHDLTGHLGSQDKIISALPDWSGRIWFISVQGVVGTVDPQSGAVRTATLGEAISNSFAVDESGGVYVVTQHALHRLDPAPDGTPEVTWREEYENSGIAKPGQVHAGSGTTPTVMGADRVAIADNADPMNVVVYRRGRDVTGPREVCRAPVFDQGSSATDQSLIATPDAIVTENNHGYTGPAATTQGGTTTPGLQRVDVNPDGTCTTRWRSSETAPSLVPKLGAQTGLVYTYTKPGGDQNDPWYLTAIDFETGETRWKRLAGTGLGFNNNYAPVTFGPDGTAYIGVLGGLAALR